MTHKPSDVDLYQPDGENTYRLVHGTYPPQWEMHQLNDPCMSCRSVARALNKAVDSGEFVPVNDVRYLLAWFDKTALAEFRADTEGERIYNAIVEPAQPNDGDE